MFSIIIPLYNKEKYIAEAINSVIKQSYPNFELIVVNDGSTDDSVSIVEKIADARVKLISIENAGVSVARNTGIKVAKYSWIALLDGDDWWAPTFLEEMVKEIAQYPNEVLFASGRSRVFETALDRYTNTLLPEDGKTLLLSYFKVLQNYLPLLHSSNVVIKENHFKNAGYFREGQKQHEDHDLWMRLAIANKVVFINKNLSFYRKNAEGSSSGNFYEAKDFNTFLKTIESVIEKLSDEDKHCMKQYASRFSALTYLKHYGAYSHEEKKLLEKPLQRIIIGKYQYLYTLSKWVPFNLYPILKKLQK